MAAAGSLEGSDIYWYETQRHFFHMHCTYDDMYIHNNTFPGISLRHFILHSRDRAITRYSKQQKDAHESWVLYVRGRKRLQT
jgi:hypothetical protein